MRVVEWTLNKNLTNVSIVNAYQVAYQICNQLHSVILDHVHRIALRGVFMQSSDDFFPKQKIIYDIIFINIQFLLKRSISCTPMNTPSNFHLNIQIKLIVFLK